MCTFRARTVELTSNRDNALDDTTEILERQLLDIAKETQHIICYDRKRMLQDGLQLDQYRLVRGLVKANFPTGLRATCRRRRVCTNGGGSCVRSFELPKPM